MRYLSLVFLVALLAGCEFKGDSGDGASVAPLPVDSRWVARATSIRIYPATRFVRRDDAVVLEARVELFDEMGDSVKGSGDFQLELREIGASGEEGPLLYLWRVELHTVEDQHQYFDPVTRTYLFYLKADDKNMVHRTVRFNVTYTTPDGKHYLASPVEIHP